MVKTKRCIVRYLFAGVVFFCSCGVGGILEWDKGHIVDDQYVPKRPNYKFKDKENNIVPPNLDTVNIYREAATYSGGFLFDMGPWFYYLMFYPKGRLLKARISKDDTEAFQKSYQEISSRTEVSTTHGYYYSKDGERIQIETFISTDTWPSGMYKIDNYHLNVTGDTLTMQNPKSSFTMIYVREKTPRVFVDYPVNW